MITGIILAAGFSRRFGSDKLLLDIQGQRMIERIIKICQASNLDRLLLIYRTGEIKELAIAHGIQGFYNPRAHLGQAESVKLGVEKSLPQSAYMFFMGDQPFISTELIDRLIRSYGKNKSSIIVPIYGENQGNPVIFPPSFRKELLEIQGDQGGRAIIKKNPSSIFPVKIKEEHQARDIDSPEDIFLLGDL